MKIEPDQIIAGLHTLWAAFEAARDIADNIAETLAETGQPELKSMLAELRQENDEARARRKAKLKAAALQ